MRHGNLHSAVNQKCRSESHPPRPATKGSLPHQRKSTNRTQRKQSGKRTSASSQSLRAVTARFLPHALVFLALIRAAGQCFSWPRRGFPLPAMNDRNALGFARRSSLAPCAQKLATTPALHHIACFCQFVLVAACRFLQCVTYFVGRSARAHAPTLRSWGCAGTAGCPAASATPGGCPPAWLGVGQQVGLRAHLETRRKYRELRRKLSEHALTQRKARAREEPSPGPPAQRRTRDHRATSPAAGPRRAHGSAAAKRARPRKCANLARSKICDFGPEL